MQPQNWKVHFLYYIHFQKVYRLFQKQFSNLHFSNSFTEMRFPSIEIISWIKNTVFPYAIIKSKLLISNLGAIVFWLGKIKHSCASTQSAAVLNLKYSGAFQVGKFAVPNSFGRALQHRYLHVALDWVVVPLTLKVKWKKNPVTVTVGNYSVISQAK